MSANLNKSDWADSDSDVATFKLNLNSNLDSEITFYKDMLFKPP